MEIALGLKYVGAGLMFGLAAIGAGVGAGILSSKLIESIARQPELEDQLRPTYFLGIGLVDAVPMISVGLAAIGAGVGAGVLSSKLIESIARQPELEDQLRPTYFLGIGLVDAVPMISVGLAFYLLFVA